MLSIIKKALDYLLSCFYNRTYKKNDDFEIKIETDIYLIKKKEIYN